MDNLNVKDYVPGDSIEVTKNKVLAHFPRTPVLYNRSVREIGRFDYINPNKEFRMALKTYTISYMGIAVYGDYHFMIQCNDETWANKLSWANSEKHPKVPHEHDWDWLDPEHPHPGPWYSAPVINWGNVVIGAGLVIGSTAAIIWVVGNDMTGAGVVDDWALPGLAGTFGKGVVMIFGG